MNKKVLLLLFVVLFAVSANAQSIKFGYFSYDVALKSMPGYSLAKHKLDDMRAQYDAEMKRSEDEFNKKYEEFLDGQRDFAPSILEKRQAELRELMEKNLAFKENVKKLLSQAEQDAYAPLKNKLNLALQHIGQAKGYSFILNTDNNAMPFINVADGEDISTELKGQLK